MKHAQLRDSLILQAEAAFIDLTIQADILLDAIQIYVENNHASTRSAKIKAGQLEIAVRDIAALVKAISEEVKRWKNEEERVLSRLGVELQQLNELYVTLEATLLFLIRENIIVQDFSLGVVRRAHADLVRCNRLL